jgi:23S rRNA (adenine2503-C2)-methyltransferase
MGHESGTARWEVLGLSSGEFRHVATEVLREASQPPYRLSQLENWVYRRTPRSFSEMSNLPRGFRRRLEELWSLHPLELVAEEASRDGTRKFLWGRGGTGTLESVLIPDQDRVTYCVSTQAGCPVGCTFCATGHGGFQGQLRAAEIVDQVLSMRRLTSRSPTNIVYMGMGEPLLNFREVSRSLEVLTAGEQVGLGSRRITVSTVGIPDRIRELARAFPQVRLALSLHAAREELRSALIPLNRRFPLRAVLEAVRDHTRQTKKRVTCEYVILPGVNDSEQDAGQVSSVLRGIPAAINLLGFNPFPGARYEKPDVGQMVRFRQWLRRSFPGEVTLRRSRGEDIRGACGQLSGHRASRPYPPGSPA